MNQGIFSGPSDIEVRELKEKILNFSSGACFDSQKVANMDPNDNTLFEDYKCQICLSEIVNNPVQCPKCHNIFGFQCALKLFEMDTQQPPTCPSCKKIWDQNIEDLKNRWIAQQISKQFKIKCKFEENGCQQQIQCNQGDIQFHESVCNFEQIKCNQEKNGCKWTGQRKNQLSHIENQCKFQEFECVYCSKAQEYEEKQYQIYGETNLQENQKSSDNNSNNFNKNSKKQQQVNQTKKQHSKNCSNKPIKCQYCKESFSPPSLYEQHKDNCEKQKFKCKSCQKMFFRNDFTNHLEQQNCYENGQEKGMFSKIMVALQQQSKQVKSLQQTVERQSQMIKQEKQQNQIQQHKVRLMFDLSMNLNDSQNKNTIIQDFEKGIYHINNLITLHEIFELGLPINTILINETDLGKYKKSQKSGINFEPLLEKIKYLAEVKQDTGTQFSLAFLYYYGDKQIQPDFKQVFELCKSLVKKDHAGGMWLLAKLFQIGDYVKQDEQMAIGLYQKSAGLSFAPGINMLGFCFCNGIGVEKDERKGMLYYQKNAQLGFFTSLFNLGCIYFNEEIVQKNEILGFQYFLKAAQKGCINAMREVAGCLREGEGVEKDINMSKFWDNKAKEYEENYC